MFVREWLWLLVGIATVSSCGPPISVPRSCGDGSCDAGESGICPSDCEHESAGDGDDSGAPEDTETSDSEAGGGADSAGTCTDDCTAGLTRCTGNVVEQCQVDAFGCAAWRLLDDCSSKNSYCDVNATAPVCIPSCVDICATGALRCLYDFVQICRLNAAGCLVWQDLENCNTAGMDCVESSGQAVCSTSSGGSASDASTGSGSASGSSSGDSTSDCSGTGSSSGGVSTNSGSHSPAGSGSDDAAPSPSSCVDLCSETAPRCSGALLQLCQPAANACLDWSTIEDCAASGQVCDDSAAPASCVDG